jgi:hypothetical protein
MKPSGANRGWRSTKLHLALITMGLISIAYIAAGCPESAFDGFCVGLLGAAGIYSAASTTEKFAKQD